MRQPAHLTPVCLGHQSPNEDVGVRTKTLAKKCGRVLSTWGQARGLPQAAAPLLHTTANSHVKTLSTGVAVARDGPRASPQFVFATKA